MLPRFRPRLVNIYSLLATVASKQKNATIYNPCCEALVFISQSVLIVQSVSKGNNNRTTEVCVVAQVDLVTHTEQESPTSVLIRQHYLSIHQKSWTIQVTT